MSFSIKVSNSSDSYVNINAGETDVDVRPGDSASLQFENDEIVMITRTPADYDKQPDEEGGVGEGGTDGTGTAPAPAPAPAEPPAAPPATETPADPPPAG